jgi:hypothetical protein
MNLATAKTLSNSLLVDFLANCELHELTMLQFQLDEELKLALREQRYYSSDALRLFDAINVELSRRANNA